VTACHGFPSPSSPYALSPKPHTDPSGSSTIVRKSVATIPTAGMGNPNTKVGTDRFVVVPSPSCPYTLRPQVHTVPSLFSATLWYRPAAIATTSFRPTTAAGSSA
jgi:hypothetical protein